MTLKSLLEDNPIVDLLVDELVFIKEDRYTGEETTRFTCKILNDLNPTVDPETGKTINLIKNKYPFVLQRNICPEYYLRREFPEDYKDLYFGFIFKTNDDTGMILKIVVPVGVTKILGKKANEEFARWEIIFNIDDYEKECGFPSLVSLYSDTEESTITGDNEVRVHLLGNHTYLIAKNLSEVKRSTFFSKELIDEENTELPRFIQVEDFLISDNFNVYSMGDLCL